MPLIEIIGKSKTGIHNKFESATDYGNLIGKNLRDLIKYQVLLGGDESPQEKQGCRSRYDCYGHGCTTAVIWSTRSEGIKGSSIKSTIINVNKNKMAHVRAEASGP